MLLKVLSHPGRDKSKCCIVGNWTCFSLLEMFHLASKRLLQFLLVSPLVADLRMEEVESRALISFNRSSSDPLVQVCGTTPGSKSDQAKQKPSQKISRLWTIILSSYGKMSRDSLAFLDCAVHTEEDRRFSIEVYRKPTHRLSSTTGAQAGGHQNPKPSGSDGAL